MSIILFYLYLSREGISGGASLQSRRDAYMLNQATVPVDASKRASDLPSRSSGGVVPAVSNSGVSENQPIDLPPEIVRSDAGKTAIKQDEMPSTNTAKSMAAKYREMEASKATAGPPHKSFQPQPFKKGPVCIICKGFTKF